MTASQPGRSNAIISEPAARVGAIIRSRREERGISLRAFARQCKLSPGHVSKIERGHATPSLDVLTLIVEQLDLYDAPLFGERPSQPGTAAGEA